MPQYDPLFLQLLWNFVKYDSTLSNPFLWIEDIIVYILSALVLYHAWKNYGRYRTLLYFTMAVFAGIEENFWIIAGAIVPPPMNTYFFTYDKAVFWFLAIPLHACFAWMVLAYSSFHMIKYISPDLDIWKQAALGAFIAVDLDLMMDPIAVRKVLWQWLTGMPGDMFHFPQIYIFGIPFSNFFGWFLLIFIFNWFWDEYTAKEKITALGKVETTKTTLFFISGLIILEIMILFTLLIVTSTLLAIFPAGLDLTIGGI
ncbi:MAG: carotenoid biosynthesis protein [Candidatus Helarchaeota archaeon]